MKINALLPRGDGPETLAAGRPAGPAPAPLVPVRDSAGADTVEVGGSSGAPHACTPPPSDPLGGVELRETSEYTRQTQTVTAASLTEAKNSEPPRCPPTGEGVKSGVFIQTTH